MELNSVDGKLPVLETHDFPLGGIRRDPQAGRHGTFFHNEGVVAGGFKGIWQAGKNALPSCRIGEVFPCIRRSARTTFPP